MTSEIWRYIAVVDVVLLWSAGYWIVARHARQALTASWALRGLACVLSVFMFLIILAVVINVLTPVPPTVGVKVIAVSCGFLSAILICIAYVGERKG